MMAANQKEVVFDLDAAAFSSDDFRMYQFKVGLAAAGVVVPPYLGMSIFARPPWQS